MVTFNRMGVAGAFGNDLLDELIPEPSNYLLLGGGLALMTIRARRNKL